VSEYANGQSGGPTGYSATPFLLLPCVVVGCGATTRDELCVPHVVAWLASAENRRYRARQAEGNIAAAATAFADWVRATEAESLNRVKP
jgi:hypothetical protein